jgi:hypothetical protein
MPKHPKRPSADELRKALAHTGSESWRAWNVFDGYGKGKPHIDDLPVLGEALKHEDHVIRKSAAASIAKLGSEVSEDMGLMEDLLEAGGRTDGSEPPQAYMECLQALVSIGADSEAIVDMVHCHFGITNWLPLRASMDALQRLATPEALDLLSRIVVFWWPELDKKQRQYVRTHFPESVPKSLT